MLIEPTYFGALSRSSQRNGKLRRSARRDGRRGGLNQVYLSPGLVVGRFRLADGIRFTTGVGYQMAVSKRHCLLIALRDSPFWFVTGCDVFGVLGIGHERWEIISRNVRARSKSGRALPLNMALTYTKSH